MMFVNRKIKRIARVLLIFFIFQTTAFAQADLVVVNANIRTLDQTKPRAEALAIVKNRISAIGTNREIRAFLGEKTKLIDAQGKLVLPGFNDAHVHFTGMGNQFFYLDLRETKSMAEIIEKLKFYARFLPAGQWISGGGWSVENWTPNDLPAKELIDAATPAHPVFLYHKDAKMALVNSLALKLARLDKNSNSPAAGEIVRDADGEPNGILKDSAMNLVRRFVPAISDNKPAVLETASNYAAAFGVTSVQDMSADDNTEIYRALEKQDKLKTRVYDCTALSDWPKLAAKNITKASGDAMVRGGCLKGTTDGDADSTEELFKEIAAADRADLQIMIHAVGNSSNAQILSVFERVRRVNGRQDRRFRIEHAHRFRARDIRRFAASEIIASVQPFLFSDGAGRSFDPLQDLLNARTTLAFGSDSAIIPVDPLSGIAAAVETNDPKQKITIEEAVRFYTSGSAFAEFQENEKGTLTVGKLADFVILSDDIFSIKPIEISQTRVLTTVMDGRVVFSAN